MSKALKVLYPLQTLVLLGGTIFAWYTVYGDFARHYQYEGSFFKFTDCIVPNPLATPCFYGAIAFLIALVWSIIILRKKLDQKMLQHKRLFWLLLAGTLFAWGNFGWGFYKFWQNDMAPTAGCSGVVVDNPFSTPCFYGALFYLSALIVSIIIKMIAKKKTI
ncbi:MAG: hypothetical protein ABIG66_01235 [Candidatus Kerfeldbacteria bacterium]